MTDEKEVLDKEPVVTEPTKKEPEAPSEKAFTQADVDRIIADRLKREKEKYADYDDMKADAENWKKHQDEQLSELERVKKAFDDEKAAREKAEASAAAVKRESEIISKASAMDFNNPADAIPFIDANVDIEEALKKLAEEKPYLIDKKSNNPASQRSGKSGMQTDKKTREEMRAELFGGGNGFNG